MHAPSEARRIQRMAREGADLRPLVEAARQLADPGFAADTLLALASERRMPTREATTLVEEALRRLDRVERDWRKAEILAEVARRGGKWREGDRGAAAAREGLRLGLLERVLALQPGEGRRQALRALAGWTPQAARGELLRKVLAGPDPVEDAKAVLRDAPVQDVEAAAATASDATAARVLAYAHAHGHPGMVAAALRRASALPAEERVEVLRAIIAALPPADLPQAHAALGDEPEARARLLCALAARADKSGDPAAAARWLDEAEALVPSVAGERQAALRRNIQQGRERLAAPDARASDTKRASGGTAAPRPGELSGRHVLALVDSYEGSFGDVHVRAIARAAPLCYAFELDLLLAGFPQMPLDRLVDQVERQTNVGEGRGYLTHLAVEGRLHMAGAELADLPGFAVATTPTPDPQRNRSLLDAAEAAKAQGAGRLVLLMGLGRKGLPGRLLRDAPVHLEVTGRNVSLETATAMGILAERLRQVPPLA
ncbi:MAG TPA: DUF531 family protein [Candidatus Thermoplasmatota archaeon]|nr:DUF531 family protein [Candidatus Thermoplasmatota archaeon]